jgi:hypothetical protein
MASLGDEIDNCGLFLEQRRLHSFCSGKLSTQQPEHAIILSAKVQLLSMQIFFPWEVSKPFHWRLT